jgi:hypothetical protein
MTDYANTRPSVHCLDSWSWRILCAAMVLASVLGSSPAVSAPVPQGVVEAPWPSGAIAVFPGASIQAAVDQAGNDAIFYPRNGVHSAQVVRLIDGQSFYGNNRFEANLYRARTSKQERFPWGHQIFNWAGLRAAGSEPNGRLMLY